VILNNLKYYLLKLLNLKLNNKDKKYLSSTIDKDNAKI